MKKIIIVSLTVILISSLNAQLPITDIRQGFRNSSHPSKVFESTASLRINYTSNKPRLDSIVYKGYDVSTESWFNGLKSIFEYSQSGAPTLYSFYYWDSETIQWILSEKIKREFNAAGDLILEIKYQYSANYDTIIYEFFYNDYGFISEEIITKYQSGVLYGLFRDVYGYDSNSHLTRTSHYRQSTIDQSWEYSYKEEYTVDTLGRITEILTTDLDVNGDEIIDQMDWMRTTFNYDTEGNMISQEEHGWNFNINDWRVHSKKEFTYNAEGQKLTEKRYVLNTENNELEIRSDDEWIYDSNGNNTTIIFRWKEESNSGWSLEKVETLYDLTDLVEDYSMPYDLSFESGLELSYFTNKPIGIKYYEFVDPDWELIFDGKYYYSDDISSNIEYTTPPEVCIIQYSQYLTISWKSNDEKLILSLYNLAGQSVYKNLIENNQTITLEHLSTGIYLYQLLDDKIIVTGKFFIE